MYVRQQLGLADTSTSTSNSSIRAALQSMNFIFHDADHNYSSVRDTLFNKDLAGHCWVCDGVRETIYNQITFFTESQPYGAGLFEQGMYSYNTPGIVGGIVYLYFHMNWGRVNSSLNTWYVFNNDANDGQNGNYQYFRKDFFISKPN